jgi:hypothetical protein
MLSAFSRGRLATATREAAYRAAKATLAMDNGAATIRAAWSVRPMDEVTSLAHFEPPGGRPLRTDVLIARTILQNTCADVK